jgi:enoyl-CoA hydratase/carnithine racemase
LSLKEGVALERKVFYPLYDTPGMKEGVSAFIAKRKPEMQDL